MATRYGYCQDPYCEYKHEKATLYKVGPLWVCDGCWDARGDEAQFQAANRMDMDDHGRRLPIEGDAMPD